MNSELLNYLVCPKCESERLHLAPFIARAADVIEGVVRCASCEEWYRIENGIVDLMHPSLRNQDAYLGFARRHHLPIHNNEEVPTDSSKQTQKEFYEDQENAEEYERLVAHSKYYLALNETKFVQWMRAHLRVGSVALDLGCGTGLQSLSLAAHGVRTLGVDISESMILWARKKAIESKMAKHVDFIVGDAENPPVRKSCFDACVFYGTLHHLEHKDLAIYNAALRLRDYGHFFSLDPHNSPVRFVFDLLMRLWKIYDEKASSEALLSEGILLRWLRDAGIKGIIQVSTYFPPHLWFIFSSAYGIEFLRKSDKFLNRVPLLRSCGGVIVSHGIKSCE